MFSFLKASPPSAPIDPAKVDSTYRALRWKVFFGIFIGYAAYYLIRKNFSLATPYLVREYGYSKTELGYAMTALSLSYGIGKFVMGNVSDRSNPKYFITIGLLVSALISLVFGFVPAVLSSLVFIVVLSALNGWFQSMGHPPGAKTLANWFSTSERSPWWSWWNISHNLGGGLIGLLAIWGLGIFGEWQSLFYFPAFIAMALAVLVFYLMHDTPESEGLPPIEEYKNEKVLEKVESAHTLSARDIFFKYIIHNKFLWIIAVANIFVYFVRYGVIDWAPAYLNEVKHFTVDKQSWAYALYEWAGVPGMLVSGYLSDKVFKRHRAPPMLLFLFGVLVTIVIYWKNPPGHPEIDYACLIAIGFLIYGPVMMIGLQAADFVPRVAVGTAGGLTGLFGYLVGSSCAGTVLGYLVDNIGWDSAFYALIVACVLAFFFIALTLFKKTPDQM